MTTTNRPAPAPGAPLKPAVPTYACPACGRQVPIHAAACPGCRADLRCPAALGEAPDVCFNRALAAVRQRSWVEAVQQLSVALYLRPSDAAAWALLGKVYAHQGLVDPARMCFVMALYRSPNDPRVMAALDACGGVPTMRVGAQPPAPPVPPAVVPAGS